MAIYECYVEFHGSFYHQVRAKDEYDAEVALKEELRNTSFMDVMEKLSPNSSLHIVCVLSGW